MRNYLVLFCFLLAGLAPAVDTGILDFGALGDSKTLCTKSIQKAVEHCAETGGGTVTVPPGTYLTNTVFLKSSDH